VGEIEDAWVGVSWSEAFSGALKPISLLYCKKKLLGTTFNRLDTLRLIFKFDLYKTSIGFSSKIEETN